MEESPLPSAPHEATPRKRSDPGPEALKSVFRDRQEAMPREKLAKFGPKALSDAELLAVFLRVGRPGVNVLKLAELLLEAHGGDLRRLSHESAAELEKIRGMGKVHALELTAMFEFARRAVLRPREAQPRLHDPESVARFLAGRVMLETTESFYVLPLDKRMRLCAGVHAERLAVATGTADATGVHPRDVFREAIRADACFVVVSHNHPSGDCTPSPQDLRLTQMLIDAGRVVGIRVADHVVLGAFPPGAESSPDPVPRFHSMRQSGDVDFD